MHAHPAAVAVFLTDSTVKFSFPDGKAKDSTVKAGDALFTPATVPWPENTGDEGMDVVLVELKDKESKMAKGKMKSFPPVLG